MKIHPLVSVQWLAHAAKTFRPTRPLRIVQAVMKRKDLPNLSAEDFRKRHIPDAVIFDLGECCDKSSELPHMLPDEKLFAEYVQHLGITNNSHVIAYENNVDFGVFASARLWWMFRSFRHNIVSVLDGGLLKWVEAGLPVEKGENIPVRASHPFQAKLNENLVKDYEAMVANVESGGKMFPVVDARGRAQFQGLGSEPRPGMALGHIKHSINIPFIECLSEERLMKDPEQLEKVFEKHGVDLEEPFTTTCATGMTACIVALAAHHCGGKHVSVYDGSWSEYGAKAPSEYISPVISKYG